MVLIYPKKLKQWNMEIQGFDLTVAIDNCSVQQPHTAMKERKTSQRISSAPNQGYVNRPVWNLWGQDTATTEAFFFLCGLRLQWLISVFVIVIVTQQIKANCWEREKRGDFPYGVGSPITKTMWFYERCFPVDQSTAHASDNETCHCHWQY